MKQKKIKFFLLAGVITLVGCVMSSCTEEVLEKTASNRIIFSVYDQGFNESKVQTRGAKVNSITSFGVSASVYDAASTYTTAGCGSYFFNESATAGTPTSYYWPTSDYKLSFFGYYPKGNAAFTLQSTANTTGAPTYAYTVPSAIGSQLDIMTGQNVNILGGGSSPVALTMKHRCAAIRFSVTNNRSTAITLNSVSIEGVKYSGTLNEDTWTLGSSVNSSSSNPFTLSYGSSIAASATVDVTGTTNIFLMLPQTIPAGAKLKVAIDGEDPLYADLTGSWVASKQYNYSLDIQNSTIIIVDEDTEIEDWVKPVIIDLGLPSGTKWARGNIVSDGNGGYKIGTETDYGAYFSWGNITPHFSANGSTFDDSYNFGTSNSGPYASTPGKSVSADIPSNDATHDAARALLGSAWHLPTKENFQELYDNTDREWTTSNGVGGWKFIKKTDHSLYVFFPAAGYGYGPSLNSRGLNGSYWSSSWYSANYTYGMNFNSSSVSPQNLYDRSYGFSVRAVQEPERTDLSMVDNAGNARASMTTANCYLVHAAGFYKLPLVYGNAIKNGAVNTTAFYPNTSGQLTRFVNHAGTGITGPWITKSGSGVNAGMGLTATSAELLWQDRSGLITSVSINGDYLEFTVGTFGGGNALIAVKNGSTILWSWHIWATTETLASTTAVNTGTGGHTYNVAAVNLGWVPTGGSGKQGYCPYYQWGRKDPFIPCNGTTNGNTNKTIYNISGANITPASITASSTGIQYESSTSATIATNIQNPIKHYYNSSNYGPCNTTYYNMWDAQNTATNNVTSATKKTIYDPCPPGFCVPTGNLWYYFGNGGSRSDSNWDSTNKGKTWTLNGASIYFPAAGYRSNSSGSLSGVGSYGFYWSATPSSTNIGRYLYFYSGGWYWNVSDRAGGFSVRPVAEE